MTCMHACGWLLLKESGLLKQLEDEHAEYASTGGGAWKKLSSLLMQLRKCCNHPFLFPDAEPSTHDEYLSQLVEGSGKFSVLSRLLAKLHAGGHRVVLFSQFTSTLDLLEDLLTEQARPRACTRTRTHASRARALTGGPAGLAGLPLLPARR